MKMIRMTSIISVLGTFFLFSGGYAQKADTPSKPAVVVTEEELNKEYKANKKGFEAKYSGKILEVSGKVEHSDTFTDSGAEVPRVEMRLTANYRPMVFVFLPEAEAKVLPLAKGQPVKIQGELGDCRVRVTVKNCKLIEVGKSPAVEVTAADLTKDCGTNLASAKEKYHKKTLIVEGVIYAAEPEKDGFSAHVILEGFDEKAAKPAHVKVSYDKTDSKRLTAAFASAKKGQKIKIKGEASINDPLSVSLLKSVVLP